MKKTILFVDDDPLLLEVYPLMLDEVADRWEIDCAEGGAIALGKLAAKKFDVVVSDMRMPDMSGIQLMNEVRRLYPEISRIIISGLGDQEEIARSLETTHQFLSKPVKAKELVATISRIGKLDTLLLDDKLKALAGRLSSLPSFPSIYLQITKELNSTDPSIETIADLTLKDPALTAKMLQVANSAAFGLPDKVRNPFDAVQFLGLNAVRSIALSAHVFREFERLELKTFSALQVWTEALRCARITRLIMRFKKTDEAATEDACTAAMLRNVGKLMLAKNLPGEFEAMYLMAAQEKIPLAEAGRKVFGASHASVAAYLFGLWGLSAPMVEAVALHLQPGESDTRTFSPLTAVHVAHVFTGLLWPDKTPGKQTELDHDYLKAVGVEGELDAWRSEIKTALANNN
ncbi:MAG TPA: response regulator [Candidatus Angelobacter sp.]|jgi:HD-like signal output (HDOD) protein|nr:response regulator [Candidatus Angelobacter sp.]